MTQSVLEHAQLICLSITYICYVTLVATIIYKWCTNNVKSHGTIVVTPIITLVAIQILIALVVCEKSYQPPVHSAQGRILLFLTSIFQIIAYGAWYLLMTYQLDAVFRNTLFAISRNIIYFHRMGVILLVILGIIDLIASLKEIENLHEASVAAGLCIFTIGYSHMIWLFNRRLYRIISTLIDDETDISNGRNIMHIMIKTTILVTMHAILTVCLVLAIMAHIVFGSNVTFFIYLVFITLFQCYFGLYVFLMVQMNDEIYQNICRIPHNRFESLCKIISGV